MDNNIRIAKAVGELAEAMEFVHSVWTMDGLEATKQIELRYPEFLERFDATEHIDTKDFAY